MEFPLKQRRKYSAPVITVLAVCILAAIVLQIYNRKPALKVSEITPVEQPDYKSVSPDVDAFDVLSKPQSGKPIKLIVGNNLINVALVNVGKDTAGFMETPKVSGYGGWYEHSSKTAEQGNIIINGHYDDSIGRPAAFWQLKNVLAGDKITIVDEFNRPFDYQVVEVYYLSIDDPDRFKIFSYTKGTQTLTLITCGGVWIPSEHNYNKRLVVRALRVN